MSTIVSRQTEVAEVDTQLAELGEERRDYERWVRARADEHVLAVQRYTEQAEQALEAGKRPPAEPVNPWPVERHHAKVSTFVGRERQLAGARQQAITSCASAVREEAHQEVEEVLAEAREHVAALDGLAKRVGAAKAAVIEVEGACDITSGRRRSLDWGGTPTAADLLTAVEHGRDLLEPGQARGGLGMTRFEVPDPQPAPEPGQPGAGAGAALAGRGRGVQR